MLFDLGVANLTIHDYNEWLTSPKLYSAVETSHVLVFQVSL